jgi:hypothetical protein
MTKKSFWKFKVPDTGAPKPPKTPPPPSPSKPWDKSGPDPLERLKLGKKK